MIKLPTKKNVHNSSNSGKTFEWKKNMSKMIKEGRMGVIANICYKYDLH